ncbi:TetR/AcrR family transcriptional regulator [Rhizobium sp. VS19-DR104.2]|uniref:TetR/AcrR family transcriptional regulator n=1 Tax=Rhizobium tumorigenes TaxID=2041385 RepID=A0AAF1KKN8_9HYPH|nr:MULTISPECIES: TetR/AcrR family transcriptional regulator [Rhizobium]MBO9101939.1 TetR/AcrR family transcriptional regulator [Rhizobium sp. L58/93]MBO9136236.1 TetR/AcrR family transcriptional regulator [Rhizobium sp. B209b/85]MBO9172110.1 TetR/AcrR family transcriptional regulator [Rhizobium sp. L245/93]MBZ5763184.1 TetR/AcrR family transcriptional regulator [Rhizobium sp. VS19-DR96]MBZ5769086.1 TetR/AcrR family transcriptional regulator [Rhizobium sp. VS19-DR129.2]
MEKSVSAVVRPGRPPKAFQDMAAERIILAATELFAGRGFAGTSMEQVAAHCGAGKDTVYRRFSSKVALFEAVVEHAHRSAVAKIAELPLVTGDPLKRLQSLLLQLLHVNMEPELIALKRITFSETVVFEKTAPIPPQPDPIMAKLIRTVEEAQEAGAICAGVANDIANHLIHCMVALPTAAAMMGSNEFSAREDVEAHFDRTWRWLINGVGGNRTS